MKPARLLSQSLAGIVVCFGLTACRTIDPAPKPMLSDKSAVEEFNYALQLFDMKHNPESRVAHAIELATGKRLEVLGPRRIDVLSSDSDLRWDVYHGAGTNVSVVGQGIANDEYAVEVNPDRTRILLLKKAIPNLGNTDELRFVLQKSTDHTRFAELLIPVVGPAAEISIDGPSRVIADGTSRYSWSVFHPSQAVSVTTDSPQSISVKSARNADLTMLTVPATNIAGASSFTIRVYRLQNGQRDADPTAVHEVLVGKPGAAGEIRASFQIEDELTAQKHFGSTFAKAFFCVKITLINDFDKPVTFQASGIRLGVRYVMRIRKGQSMESLAPFIDGWHKDQHERAVHYKGDDYVIWYKDRKPMNFTDVLNVVAYDQRHDPKNVFIKLLRSGGVIASAAGVFVTGVDYAKVVSFIQGPITENLAEFLLKDLVMHLSYLNEHALHDETSIDRLKSVEKYVFFPRGDIPGVWGLEMPVRIMTVEQSEQGVEAIVQIEQEKTKTQ